MVHADRRLSQHSSEWARQFSCEDLNPLIICRGPIRKEAMDVFDEMGIHTYGILLSEKDSITYPNALAPELRTLTDPSRVHRVPDYSGVTKEERRQRIQQMISITQERGYNSIFAGYGFMSEDEEMARSMEEAGLTLIGPCSFTQGAAGLKDKAKRTALSVDVSVTAGVDRATTLTLIKRAPTLKDLQALADQHQLSLTYSEDEELDEVAERLLEASYRRGVDLYTLEELSLTLAESIAEIFRQHPTYRVRLKAIAGGGGKGQRILSAPSSFDEHDDLESQIHAALSPIPSLVREILSEVKCMGVGDNKNIIAELNIETTRHQEIQVVGNGQWCITMGGRDCSLQMHEQKLLEVSVTVEELTEAIQATQAQTLGGIESQKAIAQAQLNSLRLELKTLERMEEEATRFGVAVGLDSISTFECIVDGSQHFFMEMNTRVQVEHRVTELCYALTFSNPEDETDQFTTSSLVELMVLLARHKTLLPKPRRVRRYPAAVEARMNATNEALRPHAGGVIQDWSMAIEGEVRDDQGISVHNPDTGVFMQYHLAGAYDSNIALLLAIGADRCGAYQKMAEILRQTKIKGDQLATNLPFHYGLVNWFIGNGVNARPTTRFIVPYLTMIGSLKAEMNDLDLVFAERTFHQRSLKECGDDQAVYDATQSVLKAKTTLTRRPVEILFADPHLLGGWLSLNHEAFSVDDGVVTWHKNRLEILADLYYYLNMERRPNRPALQQIWSHDEELLWRGVDFYRSLQDQLGSSRWEEVCQILERAHPPTGINEELSEELWGSIQSAHHGHQLGLELLSTLPYVADRVRFFDFKVRPDLSVSIPDRFTDLELQGEMARVLVPPPIAKSDEVVAISGGMFYPREAPEMPPFISVGDHFDEGEPLYIVEVMKMFNKVYASFSGVITELLVEGDGVIIKKGQPLFKVKPDLDITPEDPKEIAARRRRYTKDFLSHS